MPVSTIVGGGRAARPRAPEWRAADWLSLAATPAFLTLALLGGEGGCVHSGMTAMYG